MHTHFVPERNNGILWVDVSRLCGNKPTRSTKDNSDCFVHFRTHCIPSLKQTNYYKYIYFPIRDRLSFKLFGHHMMEISFVNPLIFLDGKPYISILNFERFERFLWTRCHNRHHYSLLWKKDVFNNGENIYWIKVIIPHAIESWLYANYL